MSKLVIGSNIYLNDGLNAAASEFDMEGKTTQETEPGVFGKNLLYLGDISGVPASLTVQKISNSSIRINGTVSSNTTLQISLLHGETLDTSSYTLSVRVDSPLTGAINVGLVGMQELNSMDMFAGYVSKYETSSANDGRTLTKLAIHIPSGTSFSYMTMQFQLELGTTMSAFEPCQYTPGKPSPENPSDLVSAGTYNSETGKYEIDVATTGKNMMNIDALFEEMYEKASSSLKPSRIIEDNKNCIKFDNTTYNSQQLYKIGYKPNTQYTFRFMGRIFDTTITSARALYFRVYYTDGTFSSIHYSAQGANWIEFRILSTSNKTVDYIKFSYGSGAWWLLDEDSFNIIEGDTTDYESYYGNTQLYALDNPLRSIGLTKDRLYIANGMLYVQRNIEYIDSYDGETITTDYMSTTGELTTGASVQYVLDEPVIEQVGEANPPILYKGINNIFTTDPLQPTMIINYENDFTPEDKQALSTGNAIMLSKIIVLSTGQVLTEDDALKSWELDDERFIEDTSTFIGEWVARELRGELHNISDDFTLYNETIELRLGVVSFSETVNIHNYTDDDVNWYSLGYFVVNTPTDDEVRDNTKFDAFDSTVLANQRFDADYRSTTFQTSFNDSILTGQFFTASKLARYALEQYGLHLATPNFKNSDNLITTNQFTGGDSVRDVLKAIAKLAHGWCRMGSSDVVYIDEISLDYDNISQLDTLTPDNYFSLETTKEIFGPVNYIAIGMEYIEGQDSIIFDPVSIEDGFRPLYIMDNPILYTQALRDANAPTAANLLGLQFEPFKSETIGHPWLLAKEPIKFVDMENNEHISYPFNITLKYNGHIRTDISAPMKTTFDRILEYPAENYDQIRKMGITVDRHTGEITTLNSLTKATADGLSTLTTEYREVITDTYRKEEINRIVSGVGVDGVVVTSVQTNSARFDENGMTYERSGAATSTTINETGVNVKNSNGQSIQFSGYVNPGNTDYPEYVGQTIVGTENIIVKHYLNVGSHTRIQDYQRGTGVFWRG